MRKIATVFATIVLLILLFVLGGMLFVYSGAYNVAANDAHSDLFRWLVSTTTERSIANHAEKLAPVELPTDSATVRRGFVAFDDMCVQCHGAPGVDRGWIGQGVSPTPPYLHEEAAEMSDAELYWVIRHGIKFTSMPALQPTHTDDQIKELVAFVKQLPSIDAAEYASLRRRIEEASSDSAATAGPSGAVHDDGHAHTH